MKAKVYTLLFSSLLCVSALADNEPWQNPQINEINREPLSPRRCAFRCESRDRKTSFSGWNLEIPVRKE